MMLFTSLFLVFGLLFPSFSGESIYTQKPNDSEAYYFTPENYDIKADGITDISDALQHAINQIKKEKNYGILFIPEGKYRISKTIHIPEAIRLIGYGKNRPEIVLGENTAGYQGEDEDPENYMFWFTNNMVTDQEEPEDANPGTFYSAFSNIDLRIEEGNPTAVALRTHYAQHGFVSHCDINIGSGRAGIYEVGNEMENVRFFGGDYGIVTGPTSPSWPMMIVDTYFEGQRKAALHTFDSGLTIVNMHVKNVPVVLEVQQDQTDRLFFENSLFENISEAAIIFNGEFASTTNISMLNIDARNVPIFAKLRNTDKIIRGKGNTYKVREFTHGLVIENLNEDSKFETLQDIIATDNAPEKLDRTIPPLPPMSQWINIKDLGAVGDGETDDTNIFKDAIANHKVIYVPQGWYHLTETLTMAPGTKIIGLHPWSTQFVIHESEPAFSGFGAPKPMIESSEGGDDIFNGIGISTGAYNNRAVGLKWMANENSFVNDVKFVGGHGAMRNPLNSSQRNRWNSRGAISSPSNPIYEEGMDEAWDNQYWSLWITNNGGGTFKDIWTANSYATNGLLVSNTSTPGRIFAMSLEHHIRNEARFHNVSNWRMYAFQFEEEHVEGIEAISIDISSSDNLFFGNLWMYRTIRVQTPKRFGMRIWDSKNIEVRNLRNYTQKLWVNEFPVWDVNKELPVYPWHFTKLKITGDEKGNLSPDFKIGTMNRLASGFDFALGLTSDSKGNVYFCETKKKRIYKWSVETQAVSLIADFPYEPFALGIDSEDHLLVVARYDPQPGFMVNGEQETIKELPDDNAAYSSWGNSGWAALTYSIDPEDPDNTFEIMPRIATSDIKNFSKTYYPSGRWHYTFDEAAVYFPDSAFVAPDGATYIQEVYDIRRTSELQEAVPGKSVYAMDDINMRTVKMDVGEKGQLFNLKEILPRGQYGTAEHKDGNLYITDGQIFVFDKNMKEIDRINLTERPLSITFGGKEGNTLFISTSHSLYGVKIK